MKIFVHMPETLWGNLSDILPSGRFGGTERHVIGLVHQLRANGHGVMWGDESGLEFDVAIQVNGFDKLEKIKAKKKFVDSHQANTIIPNWIDGVFLRSYYHQRLLRKYDPSLPVEKCFIVGNGIDAKEFQPRIEKVPGRLVWASSPDRGLYYLLRLWKDIKKARPDASLTVLYSLDPLEKYKYDSNPRGTQAVECLQLLKQDGIGATGMMDRSVFVTLLQQAQVLPYTCDTIYPSELFCMVVPEALIAGTHVILPAQMDCLEEMWTDKGPIFIEQGPPVDYHGADINATWVEAILYSLEQPPVSENVAKEIEATYGWYNVASRYEAVFLGEEMDFGKPKFSLTTTDDAGRTDLQE